MAKHRTRVGLHARNTTSFTEHDYELIRRARIETLKTMSFTKTGVYDRLRQEYPDIEFIVRLYDDRIRSDSRPSPERFVSKMLPIIRRLKPYTTRFEIHNEPNHVSGIEGWGASDDNARSFQDWYLQVLSALKKACPWAEFGFPGLALNQPHRDLAWLDICRAAVEASDWLGCHCYWQYGNMLNVRWGLRFTLYHERFPNMPIEVTEFGNSTPGLPREEMGRQYVQYYQALNEYPYLRSASSFLASSPDAAWTNFVWMQEGGTMLPVVHSVGNMERKPAELPPSAKPSLPPKPKPKPTPAKQRTFAQTGKTVRGRFLEFFDEYGLDICGYPITEQFKETGLQSQYFQRVALEELRSGQIRLKPIGAEVWSSRPRLAQLEANLQQLGRKLLAAGPARPQVKDITESLLTHATRRYPSRSLAEIDRLVIHHTATHQDITPQRLAEYQVRKLGRASIVYHFCIASDGMISQTNRLGSVTNHAYDKNQTSVGICFIGDFSKTVPTDAQLEAGGRLCAWLIGSLRLPISAIVGLSELAHTQSPGRQWLSDQRWKDNLLEEVETTLEASVEGREALVASLRAQIRTLEEQIRELEEQLAMPSFSFGAEPAEPKVSQPPMQNLIQKLPKHSTKKYKTRPLGSIRYLVIHHSAVPPSVGPRRIADYHVKKQDWPGIGYHFLIGENGTIFQGNALETISYHAVKANPRGVGISFLGNFTQDVPPPAQLRAGAHLIAWLMERLGIALIDVKGHKEFMDTACPGKQWLSGKKWKQMLRQEILRIQEEAAQPVPAPSPEGKSLQHYMLFWGREGEWAHSDWLNAQNYVGTFRSTAGFSIEEASQAENVTIVGGPLGVSKQVEDQLKAAGCRVDRIAGKDEADTKRLLDELAEKGMRFQNPEK